MESRTHNLGGSGGFIPLQQAAFLQQPMPYVFAQRYASKSMLPAHAAISVFPHMPVTARHVAVAPQQATNASVSEDIDDEENRQLRVWRPSSTQAPMIIYMPFSSPHFASAMLPGAPSAEMPWPMTSAAFSVAPSTTMPQHHEIRVPMMVPAASVAPSVAAPTVPEAAAMEAAAAAAAAAAVPFESSSSSNSSEADDSNDGDEWENQETIVGSSASVTHATRHGDQASSSSSSSPGSSPPMSSHTPGPTVSNVAIASTDTPEPSKRYKVQRIASAGRRRKEFTQQEKELMELRDLNRFATTAGLPVETLHAVKQLRRRLHNRRYARISRARAAERGASSNTAEQAVAQDEALARTLKAVDGLLAMRNPDK